MIVYLASIVCFLLGEVEELCYLDLALAETCTEVECTLRARRCRLQVKVVVVETELVVAELKPRYSITNTQWLVLQREVRLQ